MVDYAIISCDQNPIYKKFWEITRYSWINFAKITPVLIDVGDKEYFNDYGDYLEIGILTVPGISTALQGQLARIWATTLFNNDFVITSDIDMIVFDHDYFVKPVVNRNMLYNYTSDAVMGMCMSYVGGLGSTWQELFIIDPLWEDFCRKLHHRTKDGTAKEIWFTDQLYMSSHITNNKNSHRIVNLVRGIRDDGIFWPQRRIDRDFWEQDMNNASLIQNAIDCSPPQDSDLTDVWDLIKTKQKVI